MDARLIGRDETVVNGHEIVVDVWVIDGEMYWAPVGTSPEWARLAAIPIPGAT